MVISNDPAARGITDRQLDAAKAAAPYVHPRLSVVAVKQVQPAFEIAPERLSDAELRVFLELLQRVQKPVEPAPSQSAESMLLEGSAVDVALADDERSEDESDQ